MFCGKCGDQIDPNWKFCKRCGMETVRAAPIPDADLEQTIQLQTSQMQPSPAQPSPTQTSQPQPSRPQPSQAPFFAGWIDDSDRVFAEIPLSFMALSIIGAILIICIAAIIWYVT